MRNIRNLETHIIIYTWLDCWACDVLLLYVYQFEFYKKRALLE
ncbi:hypothetical protein bcere0004_54900 [Bacillus cereus BGSC 6E1]|nr:hypothetical protein bcere0004_54900 [Bacillus cereus BGSC 6E1]